MHLPWHPSSVHLPIYSHQVFTTDIPHLWPLRQPMFVLHPAIYIASSLLTLGYTHHIYQCTFVVHLEERDLDPPTTPTYTNSHLNSNSPPGYPSLDLMMASRGRNMSCN